MATQAGGNGCRAQGGGRRSGVSDADLVMRYRRGERSAYDTLAARHLPMVNAVVCCALHRQRGGVDLEARDRLVQEALVRACAAIRQCRQPKKFARWLGRIALRAVADDGRAVKRSREVHPSQLDGRDRATFGEFWVDPRYGRGGVLEILAKAEEVAGLAPIIRRALKNLTPRQRHIVTLWYREGLTNKEIARELGLNEHTVSSHLCEGRKRLRRFLDRTESDGLRRRKDAVTARGFERCRTAPRPASAPMFRLPKAPAKHAKA